MSQSIPLHNQYTPTPPSDISLDIIKDFIETQKQKALNEAKELQLREREMDLSK